MTLLSRITGLARDIAFSAWFGSGPVMDAFAVAFKIPNLMRRFFAEGAFSQAFVPVISEYRTHKSHAGDSRAHRATSRARSASACSPSLRSACVAAPLIILVFAPGFAGDDGRFALAVDMLRFTLPYILFVSLTALAGSVLNSHRRFAVAAFTPVLLNVVMIVFAGWVGPMLERPALGLAAGVLVAGIVQLAFQLPFLRRLDLLPRPRLRLAHEGVRRILKLMVPAIFGSSVAQISILLDTLIASFLIAGSISWLYYSDRLVEFPLGVFGIALATVILPRLSEQHAKQSPQTFSDTLDWALRLVLVIGVPAAVGLALLAEPLLATLFLRGEFTQRDVEMAAASLRAYAPGLLGFILVKVLAPGYFARQDTRTPVRVGLQALTLGMALSARVRARAAANGLGARARRHRCGDGVLGAGQCRAAVRGTSAAGRLSRAARLDGARVARGGAERRHGAGARRRAPGRRRLVRHELARRASACLAALVGGGAAVYFVACHLVGLRASELRIQSVA